MRGPRGRLSLRGALIGVAAVAALLAATRDPDRAALLELWMIHSAVAAILSSPIVFLGRTRVHWSGWDLLAFVLPFGVWLGLMTSPAESGKSLANLFEEPIYFSVAIPITALIRVMLGTRVRERACSIGLVTLLCLTAFGVFWWTPPLPE
jgi:hypothetical protein